jgi:hypothetical protein
MFITASGSGIEPSARMPFHCQHILMDFNELVADFPFMEPQVPVVGFGGAFGAQLLQEKKINRSDLVMVESVMQSLLQVCSSLDRRKLEILGLKKLDDDSVVLNINNRPVTTLEPEHGCCDNYYVVERRAGGSKGLSKEPKLTFPHCHPVLSSNLNSDFAVASCIASI